jgi:uncharacterized phage-associated protein
MPTCFDVADFFLANADPDEGITNLKSQKMCAYAQAFSLVLIGKRLYNSDLKAWPHGPVVGVLDRQYSAYGKNAISSAVLAEESRTPFSDEELFVLETVNGYYGRYAAWVLRDMSHNDFPGDFDNPKRPVIPDEEIRSRFSGNKVVKTLRDAA